MATIFTARAAIAAPPVECPQFFAADMPVTKNGDGRLLCYSGFAVFYAPATKTPLWAAEHLTADAVKRADALSPSGQLHAEKRLAKAERSTLADYHSGRNAFDPGQLAPAADMPGRSERAQSFALANVVPHAACSFEGLWQGIEKGVRELAADDGELYIVTGALFDDPKPATIGNGVHVPSQIYKAIYDPLRKRASVTLVPNTEEQTWQTTSVARFTTLTGVDPFPGLPHDVRENGMQLPPPERPHTPCRLN